MPEDLLPSAVPIRRGHDAGQDRGEGRDLFDLWLALNELRLAPTDIVECFAPYRPDGYTRALAEQNLRAKTANDQFRNDLMPLVPAVPAGYDINSAAEQIVSELFTLIP